MASKSKAQSAPKATTQALDVTDNTNNDKIYRVQVSGYSSPGAINRISKLRQSNQVFLIPYSKLFQEYQHFHRRGEIITSVTLVEPKVEAKTAGE
jgi:hypothetical protein